MPKPFNAEQLHQHVHDALRRQTARAHDCRRMVRLRDAVHRLNEARKTVSRKVDILCNDLINAYGELSKELDIVRNQESFRTALAQARDLEQMLCHAMDWMLQHLGHSNIAIWLATQEQDNQLAAYMKYTIPGEPELVDAMKLGLVSQAAGQDLMRLTAAEANQRLTPAELEYLKDQTILTCRCIYLGESLATLVFFRPAETPFTDNHAALLQAISPIFATALASAVHSPRPASESYQDQDPDQDPDSNEGEANDGDWWKRGEKPPF